MSNALADRIADIARRVERLSPSHREPHRFLEEKQAICVELEQIEHEQRQWPTA